MPTSLEKKEHIRYDNLPPIGRSYVTSTERTKALLQKSRNELAYGDKPTLVVNRGVTPRDAIEAKFFPSRELVFIFKNGIESAIELARQNTQSNKYLLTAIDNSELKSQEELSNILQEQIAQTFALFASRSRARNVRELNISDAQHTFVMPLEDLISKSFLVRPSDIGRFIATLDRELREHLKNQGEFAAAWGKLILRDSKLYLVLNSTKSPAYSPVEQAQIV